MSTYTVEYQTTDPKAVPEVADALDARSVMTTAAGVRAVFDAPDNYQARSKALIAQDRITTSGARIRHGAGGMFAVDPWFDLNEEG